MQKIFYYQMEIVTWSYNCLLRIIIIVISYLKLCNCVRESFYYQMEIATCNQKIVDIRKE